MKLFRSVGLRELRRIAESDWRAFPHRSASQPIFHAVLDVAYATKAASEWNVAEEVSGHAGFVTVFEVDDAFAARYEIHVVDGGRYRELQVPAGELEDFNRHIRGGITISERYYGELFSEPIDSVTGLPAGLGSGRLINYLTSDLDLVSVAELTQLVGAFDARGIATLHVEKGADGLWRATLETVQSHGHVESNVEAIVTAVESLPAPLRSAWDACKTRELNAGYECGAEPASVTQGLSNELLSRLVAIGASLRITLYPGYEPRVRRRE